MTLVRNFKVCGAGFRAIKLQFCDCVLINCDPDLTHTAVPTVDCTRTFLRVQGYLKRILCGKLMLPVRDVPHTSRTLPCPLLTVRVPFYEYTAIQNGSCATLLAMFPIVCTRTFLRVHGYSKRILCGTLRLPVRDVPHTSRALLCPLLTVRVPFCE
uniref:Uncharacterized protein n=1 Tax=Glossina pallidipes TaxID=7398 RepID=A0A1B0A1T9_GLOPL